MHNAKKTIAIACFAMLIPASHAIAAAYDAAAYLTAYQAGKTGDISRAKSGYSDALARDPGNAELLARAHRAAYIMGAIDEAAMLAANLPADMPLAFRHEARAALAAQQGDWRNLARLAKRIGNEDTAFATLLEAWADLFRRKAAGDDRRTRRLVIPNGHDRLPPVMHSAQLALMYEYNGHASAAIAEARKTLAISGADTDMAILMAGVLARNGAAMDDAIAVMETRLGDEFAKAQIIAAFADGTSPLLQQPDETALLALAASHIALAAGEDLAAHIARLRFASYLDPDSAITAYHLGRILRRIDDAAWEDVHARIPASHPYYQPVRILAALHYAEDAPDTAAAILDTLIADDGANPHLNTLAGNQARRQKQYESAIRYYDTALALGGDGGLLHFYRGIAFDMLGRDDATEAAFRDALTHAPDDAHTLNYLGYWMLEHGRDVRDALRLIGRAVAADPDNGAFVDSLGWGYFRLGRYEEALPYLERAATLEPTDPTVTDHLGDVYERLGRLREAVYEWRRALYYADEHTDMEAIRAKLKEAESERAP